MKSFFKKTAISMLIMGMAGSTFAAHSNNTMTMWSPHLTGWFIGIEGLDLRPMNGDLDYISFAPLNVNTPVNIDGMSTSYSWSWRIFGGIKFTDNDDITLSWMRMRDNEKNTTNVFSNALSVPRFLPLNDWDLVQAKVDFDLDDAYAVWGHTINFNNPWSVRYAAGFEYAKLDSDMTIRAQEFNVITDAVLGFVADSEFKGFGPRVEFDMTYHLPANFALFANTNAALLVSKREISLNPQHIFIVDGGTNLFVSNYSHRHVVVPKFGARLGVSYTAMFGQAGAEGGSCTSLAIDAGWQVESYIHAIERPDGSFFGTQTLQSFASFNSTKTSNFSDSGWFVGLTLSSDWI